MLSGQLSNGRVARHAALAAVCAALCPPATASAGQATIFNGVTDEHGEFGPRHTLTSVVTTWRDLLPSCVNAINDGGGLAGQTRCTSDVKVTVSHAYCACNLKWGWGFAMFDGFTNAWTRENW
jgi:hypothetical protein